MANVEISALPTNSSIGTTTSIVSTNGSGTGGLLLSSGALLKEALAESATGTSASGTNTVLLDIAGVPTLVPVSALPAGSGGVALTNGTLTAAGTLTFGSGLTLTGSGSAYGLAAAGGGGVINAPYVGIGWTGPVVPAASTFSIVNGTSSGGSLTLTDNANGPLVFRQNMTFSGDNLVLAGKAPGSSPWTLTILASYTMMPSNYQFIGPLAVYSSTGQFYTIHIEFNRMSFNIERWNSSSSYSATGYTGSIFQVADLTWFKLNYDGTNLNWSLSKDNINWILIFSESATAFLTDITYVGPCINTRLAPVTISMWKFGITTP